MSDQARESFREVLTWAGAAMSDEIEVIVGPPGPQGEPGEPAPDLSSEVLELRERIESIESALAELTGGQEPGPVEPEPFPPLIYEDFDLDAPEGSFFDVYPNMGYYPSPWPDTSGNGRYTPDYVSALDGNMRIRMLATSARTHVAAVLPIIPGAQGGQDSAWSLGQTYGRYEVRFRVEAPAPGFKIAWLWWPDSNDWDEGEMNFPECDLRFDSTIHAFNHQIGDPRTNQLAHDTGESPYEWHTAVLEWEPGRIRYYLDDSLEAVTNSSVPDTPFHWVLQCETSLDGNSPRVGTEATILVDYVKQWAYPFR